MNTRILWIESKRANTSAFILALQSKGFRVDVFRTANAALKSIAEYQQVLNEASQPGGDTADNLQRIESLRPHLIVVNSASFQRSGVRICQMLRESLSDIPIILIVEPGAVLSKSDCASLVLTLPFTTRKLINKVMLFSAEEGHSSELRAGPIRLDIEHRQVRIHRKKIRLTPRLTSLLRALMQKPGEVIERENLFRQVWNTEYAEDTRTLDVHISWLRRAIEQDPRRPVFLKTIRGVGYRLDV